MYRSFIHNISKPITKSRRPTYPYTNGSDDALFISIMVLWAPKTLHAFPFYGIRTIKRLSYCVFVFCHRSIRAPFGF